MKNRPILSGSTIQVNDDTGYGSEKETYWSRFASDFEDRNRYVIGIEDFNLVKQVIGDQHDLGDTLELGCGNGIYSEMLAPNADHLWATDFSDEMLAAAGARLKKHSNITIEKQDCTKTDYENNFFDTVVMVNLLHIIPDPEKALKEANRILKPGGKIIVLSFTIKGMSLLHKIIMIYRYLKTYGKPPESSKNLCPGSVKDMITKAGFSVDQSVLVGNRTKAVFATGFSKKNSDRLIKRSF